MVAIRSSRRRFSVSEFASASLDGSIAFGFADPPVIASRAKPDRLLGPTRVSGALDELRNAHAELFVDRDDLAPRNEPIVNQ